jgi:hypothetical protein
VQTQRRPQEGSSIPLGEKIFSFKEKFFRVSGRFQYQSERSHPGRAALNYASLTSYFAVPVFYFAVPVSEPVGLPQRSKLSPIISLAGPGWTADVSPTVPAASTWYASSLFTSENTYSCLSQLRKVMFLLGQET